MDLTFETVLSNNVQSVNDARQLFKEYAKSLNFSLCFQGFDKELDELPGEYSPPSGRLFLVFSDDKLAGCVALRKIDGNVCEMKRLYLRPEFRGNGVGKKMTAEIIRAAQTIGYTEMRLDTVPIMKEAISIYRSMGFKEIEPYRDNPIPSAIFMELSLRK